MNPKIGLYIEDSELKSDVEKALLFLELVPVALTTTPVEVEGPHIYISDRLSHDFNLPLILIQPSPDFAKIRHAVNGGKDLVWFKRLPDRATLTDVIKNALEDSVWSQQSIMLSREINLKNRQLEEMNNQLENIVEARTSSVAEEKKEAELKQKKIRRLVDFVQRLSESESLSDYIESVKKEFRANFAVTDVFLFREKLNKSSKDLRLSLANQLSRPVGRVLHLQLHNRLSGVESPTYLLVEHGMTDETVGVFMNFAAERLQILGLALERIILFDELTKSSLEWENTFDTLNDPVGIVDVDYRLLRSNRSFGNSPYRNKCHKIFAGSDSICEGCPIQKTAQTSSFQTAEVRRNGRVFRVHSYPIRMSQDTSVTTVVNHYVDITEDRQLYSRVIQHEKMTALGIMAGHIAHELNNPLTGIRSLCQVLGVDPAIAKNIRDDLREIENASERCQIIIRNLLEFTLQRDENGVQPTYLNDVVQKTLPMLKTAMRFHSTNIDLDENEKAIHANPHLLQQVVFNLVNNSCQAMIDPGEVTIETESSGGKMYLRVKDTGPGIKNESISRLFEPFYTTKAQGEGTGLGLSISRTIVEKFDGKIELLSTGPNGSCFQLSFPLKLEER